MIPADKLDADLAICATATPGPWRAGRPDMISDSGDGPFKAVYCDNDRGGRHHVTGQPLPFTVAHGKSDAGDPSECIANAQFIARARTALPEYVAEVKRLNDWWDLTLGRLLNDARSIENLTAEVATLRALLDLAQGERDALATRRDELLAAMVRVTNETPFPEELKAWPAERRAMIAEVGTLKARIAELEATR